MTQVVQGESTDCVTTDKLNQIKPRADLPSDSTVFHWLLRLLVLISEVRP